MGIVSLINSSENGATEVPGTSNSSLFVFLAGPIRYWWTPGLEESYLYKTYSNMRDNLHEQLSKEFLVYAPHRAWRGPWDERAQALNDNVIRACDAVVYLDHPHIPAAGTSREREIAVSYKIPCLRVRFDGWYNYTTDLEYMKQHLLEMRKNLVQGN